jgi:DNA repair protein SbcD/Mre11
VEVKHPPQYAMVQVTLDGLSREHGKGIDTKMLAPVREKLLDLKIRVIGQDHEHATPLQQDLRTIDYLTEFGSFVGKQQLGAKQKAFVQAQGLEALQAAMDQHREDGS